MKKNCKYCNLKNNIHKISCPKNKKVISQDVLKYYEQMEKEVHFNRGNLNK